MWPQMELHISNYESVAKTMEPGNDSIYRIHRGPCETNH